MKKIIAAWDNTAEASIYILLCIGLVILTLTFYIFNLFTSKVRTIPFMVGILLGLIFFYIMLL